MKNRVIKFLGVAAVIVFVLAGCGPSAHVETSRNANFNKYRTFAWAEKKDRRGRTGGSTMMENQIKTAISSRLESRMGWQQVSRNPDVVLSYDVLVERGSRVESDPRYSWGGFRTFYNPYSRRFYNVYYPSRFMGYDNYEVPTKEGTITVTMVDADNDETVMQGWATDEVNSRRISAKEIDRIVDAIFRKWESSTRNAGTDGRRNAPRYGGR
ncbi:DUF4136 domain-containing protein [Niabella beijingensis]|uniref:DUF4136 domain-containing protein n=1 Tax=Niabella beijingensis TaxID=2872700 RepID=UPI001CBE0CAB|nr:DUF4136 domain-containing protein [Niabella beijingensis]MBZ4187386.1 DUF4136 domain-containing protein [Niabella beijingensis]